MWQQLDIATLENTGGDYAIAKRAFGLNGSKWPRIVVSVYPGDMHGEPTQVVIAASRKDNLGCSWYSHSIPRECLPVVSEMLIDVMTNNLQRPPRNEVRYQCQKCQYTIDRRTNDACDLPIQSGDCVHDWKATELTW